jgi:hypothetical protein
MSLEAAPLVRADLGALPAPQLAVPRLPTPLTPMPPAPVPAAAAAAPPRPHGTAVTATRSAVRRSHKRLGEVPGLTLAADTIAARHCVDLLAARLKEDPDDPRRHVWLAEAVLRTRRDLGRWAFVRTLAHPSSLVLRTALRGIAWLAAAGGSDPAEVLLRRAITLAGAQARESDVRPVALHVLARVYLARGMPADAIRLAGGAAAVESDEQVRVLITAARALQALRRRDDAERVAQAAVDRGNTLGYELLARLLAVDRVRLQHDPAAHARDLLDMRRRVRQEDRVGYFGAARSPAEIALAVKSTQWRKMTVTFSDAVNLAGRARTSARKEPSS